jgi:uncharacterized protein YyaL (SSP411 family)
MILFAMTSVLLVAGFDAAALSRHIESSYLNPTTGYYREELNKPDTAFNWTLGIVLSAQNSMARLDPSRIAKLKATLEKADTYWNSKGPWGGFDVQPGPPHPNDRYYDDNDWMVMSMVESYEITKDHRWLSRAEDSLNFSLSGEDSKLDGGIYWREKDKASKNTCSNGPAAAACLAVYKHTHRKELLQKAETIYAWTKKKLQDPTDGIYFDSLHLDGKLDKTKWSYNSALMLRTAHDLYEITKLPEYKADHERLQDACIKRWVKSDGSINDELQFSHLLFENLDPNKFDAAKCIEKLKSLASNEGYFPSKWSLTTGKTSPKLLIQASALRAIATYELWVKQGKVKPL